MAHNCVTEFNATCQRCVDHDASCGRRCGTCGERMCAFFGPVPATDTCASHDDECADCNAWIPCRQCAETRAAA